MSIQFCHHLGILFFSEILLRVEHVGGEFGWLLKQWLCSILLGAVISDMRSALGMEEQRVLTFVFDRGIYGQEPFDKIIADPALHIVTWEKNYSQKSWDTLAKRENFFMHRPRNRANDLKTYHFEYQIQSWSKNPAMRLICVRATNPSGRTIELGILTDDANRPAQELPDFPRMCNYV